MAKRNDRETELEHELMQHAEEGNLAEVRVLVEELKVSVECADERGWTPLMLAVGSFHENVARFLLEKRANPNPVDITGGTPIAFALFCGDVRFVGLLLEYGVDVDSRYDHDLEIICSLLGYAIWKRDVAMVRLLLRYGANTQETLFDGETDSALDLACRGGSAPMVQLLLDHDDGVDINDYTPRSGDRPAMSLLCTVLCARYPSYEIAQLLVHHGARVIYNGKYPDVPCPLMHAVHRGSTAIVQFLLENSDFRPFITAGGVHPLARPFLVALQYNKHEAGQLLLDRGVDVNSGPFLWKCAYHGAFESVQFLLRVGADVDFAAQHPLGRTPLWTAAAQGHAEIVQELLNAGANIGISDSHGETPLGVAHRLGRKRVFYLLLRRSPDAWSKLREPFGRNV